MRRFIAVLSLAFLLVAATALQAQEVIKPSADADRVSLPKEYKWDLSVLFPTPDDWKKGYALVERELPSLGMCKGKLGTTAKATLECLNNAYGMLRKANALAAYAFQWWSEDMLLPEAQEANDLSVALIARIQEATAFFDPELQQIPEDAWARLETEEPGLKAYSFIYRDLKRRQAHVLDARGEALVALTIPMRDGPYNAMNSLTQEMKFPRFTDESGNEVQLAFANFPLYRAAKDRRVRKDAVTLFFQTLSEYRNSLAGLLATSVKGYIFEARARGYASSIEMSLDADNVPVSVYDGLVATSEDNLPNTLHRYVALRKRVLGLEDIHYYDMYNPLFPASEKTYTYQDSIDLLRTALAPMGKDYVSEVIAGMTPGSGWTDVFPNKGKQSGAYCNAAYGYHPFVLLNFMGDMDDVFTAAHEFGHAMHFTLSNRNQPYPVADAPIFLAEVASTFHEELLLSQLLKKAKTKEEKLVLLNKRVENIRLTITRQTMFAHFEKLIHAEIEAGGALTAERLNEIYRGLVDKYFGPDFTLDEFDASEWSYIPHFYYNFYVYKYSTGLMASIVFAQRVMDGRKGAVEQYRKLLEAGGSDYPLTLLADAGLDLASREIVQATYDLFARTLDEMEKLLK